MLRSWAVVRGKSVAEQTTGSGGIESAFNTRVVTIGVECKGTKSILDRRPGRPSQQRCRSRRSIGRRKIVFGERSNYIQEVRRGVSDDGRFRLADNVDKTSHGRSQKYTGEESQEQYPASKAAKDASLTGMNHLPGLSVGSIRRQMNEPSRYLLSRMRLHLAQHQTLKLWPGSGYPHSQAVFPERATEKVQRRERPEPKIR